MYAIKDMYTNKMYITKKCYLYMPNSDYIYEGIHPVKWEFKKFNFLILISNKKYKDMSRYFKHNKRAYVRLNDENG